MTSEEEVNSIAESSEDKLILKEGGDEDHKEGVPPLVILDNKEDTKKIVVKRNHKSEEWMASAEAVVLEAMDKFKDDYELSEYVVNQMSIKWPNLKPWNCLVGKRFGGYVTPLAYVEFTLETNEAIIVFRYRPKKKKSILQLITANKLFVSKKTNSLSKIYFQNSKNK